MEEADIKEREKLLHEQGKRLERDRKARDSRDRILGDVATYGIKRSAMQQGHAPSSRMLGSSFGLNEIKNSAYFGSVALGMNIQNSNTTRFITENPALRHSDGQLRVTDSAGTPDMHKSTKPAVAAVAVTGNLMINQGQ